MLKGSASPVFHKTRSSPVARASIRSLEVAGSNHPGRVNPTPFCLFSSLTKLNLGSVKHLQSCTSVPVDIHLIANTSPCVHGKVPGRDN